MSTSASPVRALVFLSLLIGFLSVAAHARVAWGQQPVSVEEDSVTGIDFSAAPSSEHKSPGRALLYSLGGTVG